MINKIQFANISLLTRFSATKGAKEIFDRSVKQFYIIILGLIATILVFTNDKNSKNKFNKTLIFLIGLFCIVLSEINSEFLNISPLNNILLIMLPFVEFFFISFY